MYNGLNFNGILVELSNFIIESISLKFSYIFIKIH